MMPPLITVGSSCAVSRSAPIIEVVVVLPCVPATAIAHLRRISSPSISARRTTGTRRVRAATSSGLSDLIAEIGVLVTDHHRNAEFGQAARIAAFGDVAALNLVAEIVQHLGNAGHADA